MGAVWRGVQLTSEILAEVFREFARDDCIPLAGSLAFFTLFSFAPILALVVDLASLLVAPALIEEHLAFFLEIIFGPAVADQSQHLLEALRERQIGSPVARIAGIALLLFAATMVLSQAQRALNRVWAVERRAGFGGFLFKRLVSMGVIVGLVIVLLASVVVSAVVSSLGPQLDRILPAGVGSQVIGLGNAGISFGLLVLAAVLVHRVLPEARIPWSDAAIGGVVTAGLLTAGHQIIGWVLSETPIASSFGAAQSLALLLFWVFYSSGIVLWGAEFTKVIARRRGHIVAPVLGAERTGRSLARLARRVAASQAADAE